MNQKDLRKAAFAVGFGFTFGRAMGKMADTIIDGIIIGVTEILAKNGSESAQHICSKAGIKIKSKESEKSETDKVIGFRFE